LTYPVGIDRIVVPSKDDSAGFGCTESSWTELIPKGSSSQRIPMRVRVDTADKQRPPLRAGMSIEVDVDTGYARGLPHFLAALFGLGDRRA
jgi:hypothetical protein